MGYKSAFKDMNNAKLVKAIREIPPEYHTISREAVFREFGRHARAEKKVFVVIFLSVLLQGGVTGGTLYLLKYALDQFFQQRNLATVLLLIGTLFLATVFKSGLEFLFNWKKTAAVTRIHDKLVTRAFRDLLMNPFRFHIREQDRKKYRWVLKDSLKFIESFFGMFNAWGKQPFILLSTITALWLISPLLTLVGIILVPLGIPCIFFLKRKTKAFIAQRKMLLGSIEEIVSESIRSIRIIKVFGLEERNVDQLEKVIDKQRDINMKNAFYLGLMPPLSELIGFIGLTVIIFAGSQRLIGDNFTTGTFFVFIMAFLNVYRPLKDISNGFMNYQFALDAGRRLIILRQRAALAENNQGQLSVANFDRLEIKNLWFSYYDRPDDRKPYLLKDLSMEIQAGETVAIAGPTGIGKSTLCDLICRLYQPCQGEILINGTPAPSINKESYTRLFSLCSQETIVFNNSLLDEIRIAAPEASQEEVMEAAEAAGLSRLIKSGQRDWNTWIGNRGVQFSGGQRQMIAIARALLRKPKVLILDEAMSGLDIQMIRTIWQNIRKLLPDTAIITVSHNWEVIKQAQRILILREGRIQNSMKPIDISDRDSFFKDLNLAQVECHEEDDSAASLHDRPAQL